MRTLYTPFRVYSTKDSTWVYVDEIGSGPKDELLYFVNGQAHIHSQFQIRIHF
jgi:hypothetical protein